MTLRSALLGCSALVLAAMPAAAQQAKLPTGFVPRINPSTGNVEMQDGQQWVPIGTLDPVGHKFVPFGQAAIGATASAAVPKGSVGSEPVTANNGAGTPTTQGVAAWVAQNAAAAAQALGVANGACQATGCSGGDQTVTGWNIFGVPRFQFGARGKQNAVVGIADNGASPAACLANDPNNICAFPTGITGLGTLTSTGNQTFGGYFVGFLKTTGTATAVEMTAQNNSGQRGDYALPANTAFGTPTAAAIAATLGCAGTNTCANAMRIVQDGGTPSQFEHGIYVAPRAVLGYGLYFDSDGTNGALNPVMIRHTGKGTTIEANNLGPVVPTTPVFYSHNNQDGQGTSFAKILQSGAILNYWWTLDPTGKLVSQSNATYQAVTAHDFTFAGQSVPEFEVSDIGSATSGLQARGGTSSNAPQLQPIGAAASIDVAVSAKGGGRTLIGSSGTTGSPVVEQGAHAGTAYSANGVGSAGFTVSMPDNTDFAVLDGPGNLSNGALVLPPNPTDGQEARVACGVTITTLTIQASKNLRTPSSSSCAPGGGHGWKYVGQFGNWYGLY